jgi:hypothetical protein
MQQKYCTAQKCHEIAASKRWGIKGKPGNLGGLAVSTVQRQL